MLRTISGVILGYIVMALLVFVLFSIAYVAMGPEGAFKPGFYDVTMLWLVVSIVLSIIAALAGGFACAAIAKHAKAPLVLAVLVLVLGLALAIPALKPAEDAPPLTRSGDVGNMQAMQNAEQPTWLSLVNPFIGALGVILGSRLRRTAKSGTGEA
jgi:magnesium-transporting ATPase (P-type)